MRRNTCTEIKIELPVEEQVVRIFGIDLNPRSKRGGKLGSVLTAARNKAQAAINRLIHRPTTLTCQSIEDDVGVLGINRERPASQSDPLERRSGIDGSIEPGFRGEPRLEIERRTDVIDIVGVSRVDDIDHVSTGVATLDWVQD